MPNEYSITIKNQTGAVQDYSFFSSPPIVGGSTSGELWSNVMMRSTHVPDRATCKIVVSTDYHAVCGSSTGSPEHGSAVEISKSVQVNLGSETSKGVTMGSTISLTVTDDKKDCNFGPPTDPGQGKIGSFQLITPTGRFTVADARENNFLVGIANGSDGTISNAMGSFTPHPGSTYQISASTVFHVASGSEFNAGALVKIEAVNDTLAVDFTARKRNDVVVIHNDQLQFVFE